MTIHVVRNDGEVIVRKPYARPALIKRDRLALVSGISVLSGVAD